MLLAGDIGGTKTHLGIYTEEKGIYNPLAENRFPSADYPDLDFIVQQFLSGTPYNDSIKKACFGVAGPVINGQCKATNLPWIIDERRLATTLHIAAESVRLLNDLEAIATAIPGLRADDLHMLYGGEKIEHGNLAVVAPGTGLGEAFMTWDRDGNRYYAHASEGGHTDFAPLNEMHMALLRYMFKKRERVSYEVVCSGMGIPNLYHFLKDEGYAEEPDWLAEQLAQAEDPTPIIMTIALDESKNVPICTRTLHLFVEILGSECGNMGLKISSTGGIYLGGGIPPRIIKALEDERFGFLKIMHTKGRLSPMVVHMPVYVILNAEAALLGAAYYGLEILK